MLNNPPPHIEREGGHLDGDLQPRHDQRGGHHQPPSVAVTTVPIPSEGYPPIMPPAGMTMGLRPPPPPPPAPPVRPMGEYRLNVVNNNDDGGASSSSCAAPPPPSSPSSIPTPPTTPPGSFARTWLRGGGGGGGGGLGSSSNDDLARSLRSAYSQFDGRGGRRPPSQILSEALALSSSCCADDDEGQPPCFLTVLPDDPRIVVVHGLATYAEHFGARNPHQGRVLAFMGDIRPDDHPGDGNSSTPPLLMAPVGGAPPDTTAQSLFGSRRRRVPRREVLTEFFEGRAGNGDGETLHPTPDEAEMDHRGGRQLNPLPKLAYVPPSWAVHFLGGPRPYDALRTAEGLAGAEGLSSGGDEDPRPGEAGAGAGGAADPLLDWLRAACCRRSNEPRDAYRSAMSVEWTPVLLPPPTQPSTDDARGGGGLRGWARRRMRMLLLGCRPSSSPSRGDDVAGRLDAVRGGDDEMRAVGGRGGQRLAQAAPSSHVQPPMVVVPTHHHHRIVAPSPPTEGGGGGGGPPGPGPNLVTSCFKSLDESSSLQRERGGGSACPSPTDRGEEEDEEVIVDPWEELGVERIRTTGIRRLRDGSSEGVLTTIVVPASVEEAVKGEFCHNREGRPKFGKRLNDETGCRVGLRGRGVTSRAFPYRYGEDRGGNDNRMEILAEGTEDRVASAEGKVLELLRDLLLPTRARPPSPSSPTPPPPAPGSTMTPGNGRTFRGRRRVSAEHAHHPRDRAAEGGGGGDEDASAATFTSPLYRPLTVSRKRKYDHNHDDDVDDDDNDTRARGDNDGRRPPVRTQRPDANVSRAPETRQSQGNRKKNNGRGLQREGVDLKVFVPDRRFQVDDAFMSRLIGKGGSVIKKLMKKTNCKLSLNFDEKKMYISGIDQRQIDEAVDII